MLLLHVSDELVESSQLAAALLLGTPVAREARQVGLLDVLHHVTLLLVDKLAVSTVEQHTSCHQPLLNLLLPIWFMCPFLFLSNFLLHLKTLVSLGGVQEEVVHGSQDVFSHFLQIGAGCLILMDWTRRHHQGLQPLGRRGRAILGLAWAGSSMLLLHVCVQGAQTHVSGRAGGTLVAREILGNIHS